MPAHVINETLLFDGDEEVLGRQLFDCVADLYPICRSITGDGVRETLARLGRIVPVQIHEVPSGTEVFDWTIPDEWNVHDACVKDARGERVIDFRSCNLHLVNYSVPFRGRMLLEELRSHLFALPDRPAIMIGVDPLPHLLLSEKLGLLSESAAARCAAAG